ncbi:hypothetical protein SAMN05216518_1262 [Bacteroidales bacterium KHT7]|nr:hypothetical protein SAMN05216518_1262 [Bacteroidales bacterium KHT7]
MLRNEKKKIIFRCLDAKLKPLGWKAYKSGYNPTYVLDSGFYKVSFYMGFSDYGYVWFENVEIAINEVELYISENDNPQYPPMYYLCN